MYLKFECEGVRVEVCVYEVSGCVGMGVWMGGWVW